MMESVVLNHELIVCGQIGNEASTGFFQPAFSSDDNNGFMFTELSDALGQVRSFLKIDKDLVPVTRFESDEQNNILTRVGSQTHIGFRDINGVVTIETRDELGKLLWHKITSAVVPAEDLLEVLYYISSIEDFDRINKDLFAIAISDYCDWLSKLGYSKSMVENARKFEIDFIRAVVDPAQKNLSRNSGKDNLPALTVFVGNSIDNRRTYGQRAMPAPFALKGLFVDRCDFVGVEFLVEEGDLYEVTPQNNFLMCTLIYRGSIEGRAKALAPFIKAGPEAARIAAAAGAD